MRMTIVALLFLSAVQLLEDGDVVEASHDSSILSSCSLCLFRNVMGNLTKSWAFSLSFNILYDPLFPSVQPNFALVLWPRVLFLLGPLLIRYSNHSTPYLMISGTVPRSLQDLDPSMSCSYILIESRQLEMSSACWGYFVFGPMHTAYVAQRPKVHLTEKRVKGHVMEWDHPEKLPCALDTVCQKKKKIDREMGRRDVVVVSSSSSGTWHLSSWHHHVGDQSSRGRRLSF